MSLRIATLLLCASLAVPALQAAAQSPQPQSAAAGAHAATKATPANSAAGGKAAPSFRTECVDSAGLCVTIPASWYRLGNVFDDLGFVAAEPQTGVETATWPQLTVAAMNPPPAPDTPAQSGDDTSATPSLDSLVELVLAPGGAFGSSQTLQRTHLLLNGAPAEIVRAQLYDRAGNPDAIEAVALIQGDDGLVYTIALRCAPSDFARLEPVFQATAASWHIQTPEPAPGAPSVGPQPSTPPPPTSQPKPYSGNK